MSRKHLLTLFLCISCSMHAIAQADYYYYNGNKIPLTRNDDKVCVSIPKDCAVAQERILANVQVLTTVKDEAFDIIVISKDDFEKLSTQETWTEDAKSVIVTHSYFTENGYEVFATPYMSVRLNREADIDKLNSYAAKYRLKVVGHSPLMPLWYFLNVTQESEKSALDTANEIYESGDFASAVPDLAAPILLYEQTTGQALTTATESKSPDIYDLQGRRLAAPPAKGIYVKDGRKVVVR